MGKTKKLYLVKRMMAMILAVAMSVTLIPSTALAAPADDAITEGMAEDTGADTKDDAAADSSSGTEDDATVDTGDAEAAKNAADAEGGAQTDEDDNAIVGNTAGVDSEPADNNTETVAEGDAAPAAVPVYEISVSGLKTEAVYDGTEPFDLSGVELTKTENGNTETVSDTVAHRWEVKGEDGNYAALTGEPVKVGVYKLTLSCPAVVDVHDSVEKIIEDLEIKKAPLTIRVKQVTAKPGALKDSVKVEIDSVEAASADQSALTKDAIDLAVTDVRDAIGNISLKADEKLKKNGDYVVDITPSLKADASAAAKEAAKNYEIEPFTADIVMGELTETRIVVTLADKWKETGEIALHVYDGKPANDPAATTDYTCEVQYLDETAPTGWSKLEGVEAVRGWKEYEGCKKKEDGTVEPPTDAGTYYYGFTYEDKTGVYADSTSDADNTIAVVIEPAKVTVGITTKATEIKAAAGTLMTKVLSQIKYEAKTVDRAEKSVTIKPAENHIWGTGYNDSNVSQIYEPAFMLQVKDGQAWKSISDPDYRMEGGKEYRIIYDGKKAIYNADGTYAHRTDINSGLDKDGEEINGVSSNYLTDITPTADDQALTFTAEAGVEVDWDLEALLKDNKAGATPETAGAKEYDNTPLYANKSDYKNKVKLKGVTETGKTLNAIGSDFTYTWYENDAEDLLDKEILDQNQANGFTSYGFEDGWNELGNIVAPTGAGIYKLKIEYEDNTDDGTFYYVKDEKPAEVYFVINKVQLTITPEGEYSTLSGRTAADFFNDNEIKYQMLDKEGKPYTAPKGVEQLKPYWNILEHTKQDGSEQVNTSVYEEDDDYSILVSDAKTTYEIQANAVRYWDGDDFYRNYNYTTSSSVKTEEDAVNAAGETRKRASRKEESLSGKVGLKVNPMGTTVLTITPTETPAELTKDTFDGKVFTEQEKNQKLKNAYTIAKTENGQQVPMEEDPGVRYLCVNKANTNDECMLEDLRNAGEYNLYACFWGDETYAPLDLGPEPVTVPGVLIGTVKIGKCPVKLQLKVDDTYQAGYDTVVMSDINDALIVTGYVKNDECDDEWAFRNDGDGIQAWMDGPDFLIYEKGSKTPLEGSMLHRNKEFEIHYDAENSNLDEGYNYESNYFARNYEVATTADEILCTFKTVAAPAQITSVTFSGVKRLSIATTEQNWDKDGNVSQTVEVQEGIGYSTYSLTDAYGESVNMTGNLAAFTIYAPAEFSWRIPGTAMYRNEVEKAGGRVIAEYSNRFVVLFDAAKGAKSFVIRWEDKYVETIKLNFNKEQCLGNLQDAVAPKSLAFNAAPKKLAIGSSVQLDVKITKAQMADVICLGYKSSDESVMHVNPESGYVTALKKAKATITVYPQHMNESGEMVPIEGAKTATVTIEGTTVTAPKPVKVTSHGMYADVDYGVVADGYRREIYVVAGKSNVTLIEESVKKLQGNKNQWRNDFVIEPIYQDSADESLNRSRYDYTARLTKLQTDSQYTVYVRNVCEAKTLSDGNVITQSTVDASAAGTAVTFKTLKSEARALDLKLDETLDGIRDVTYYDSDAVPAFYSDTRTYVVDFSKFTKGLASKTLGQFYLNASDSAADSSDYLNLELPIKDKKYAGVYQNPKLEYYVWTTDKNGNRVRAQKNDFVSIDKNGKIKLTGISGWYNQDEEDYGDGVYIYVRDTNLNKEASIRLLIMADVDSVTAKKKTVNLSVGQSVNLNDIALYNYKVGKTKLTSYRGPDMDMSAVRTAVQAQKDYFRLEDDVLTAIKGGGKLELSLTDKNVKKVAKPETNATAKITFVSKDLAPVKKIKGIDITNDQFGLTFTHAGDAEAFRVEIIDSSNKKLLDKQYVRYDENGAYEVWAVSGNKYRRVKDTYRIDAWLIQRDVLAGGGRLAKESQYTVKISALYEGVSTKPATGKVKTTKIPAQDWYLEDEYEIDSDNNVTRVIKPRGGMSISVSERNKTLYVDEDGGVYNDYLSVLSGNSYTLTANPSNRGRVNDTLVWTIGDKKVASVKAAAGTYCITLKGLKPGSTVLEVKSKILGNKVIARYDIYVVAVGDAYKNSNQSIRYYGDDEPEDWNNPTTPGQTGDNAPDYLPLSVGDSRKVRASQYNYFSFTAPETAKYRFSTTGSLNLSKKTSKTLNSWQYTGSDLGWLQEGATIYLRSSVSGSAVNSAYYVEIELTQRMESAENGKTVTGQGQPASFEFKAPETGQYQFSLSYGNNSKETLYLYTNVQDAMNQAYTSNNGQMVEAQIQKGDSVWLTTQNRALRDGVEYTLNAKKISEDVALGTPKPVTLTAGETKYLMYTIEKSGRYQFSAAADTVSYSVSGEVTVNGETKTSISSTDFSTKLELNQGDVVWVKVTNVASADVTFTVNTADITPADLSTATGDVKINGSDTFYTFTASTAGAYKFTLTVDQASASDAELKIWSSIADAESYYGNPLATGKSGADVDGKATISADILLAAGQIVYVNPVNNSGSELTVGVAGAKDTSVPEITAAGTNIALQTNQERKAIFVADSTGIYEFTTAGELNYGVDFTLDKGGSTTENIFVSSSNALSKKVVLRSGQAVIWTMTSEDDMNISLKANLTNAIAELKLGQASLASVLGNNDAPDGQATATGFVFTAPATGIYTFWSEQGEKDLDTYAYLYDINKVDAEYCLLHSNGSNNDYLKSDDDGRGSGYNFAIEYELQKGAVVYLKCRGYNTEDSGSFPVYVGQGSQPWNN